MRTALQCLVVAALFIPLGLPSQTPRPGATVISGTLVGSDGAPLKIAEVRLRRGLIPRELARSLVGTDGRFAIATPDTGVLWLEFSGADHYSASVPLVLARPSEITIAVRLKHYQYSDSLDRLTAIGDWNHFQFGTGKPLVKRADGRYTVEVPADSSADSVAYELLGLEKTGGRSINGTQAAHYVYDGGGDYRSVIPAMGGRATIVLDPSQLDLRPSALTITFGDTSSPAARLYAAYSAWHTEEQAFFDSSSAARTRRDSVHYDWSPVLGRLRTALRGERDPLTHQLLVAELVDAASLSQSTDLAIDRKFIAEVSPASSLFSLYPNALNTTWSAFGAVYGTTGPRHGLSDSAQRHVLDRYDSVAAVQPDSTLQAEALQNAIFLARGLHEDKRFNTDYTALVTRYPTSSITRFVESQLAPDRPLRSGVTMPEFTFADIGDSTATYTPASFAGKVVLVDFWATWCGPCLSEMPYLEEVHDSLASRGLAMINVSLDEKAADVTHYRQGEWKMPWVQAFAPGGFENAQIKKLQVLGIPTVVLLGRDGKIIAVNDGLRGEELVGTVRRALEAADTK